MRSALRIVMATALVSMAAAPARAEIIFYFNNPGALQPEENVLFNDDALILSGLTVEGLTNQTGTQIDITGQETLVADGGQARVSTTDNGFTWLQLAPHNPETLFGQFEANLKVYSPPGRPPSGTVTVAVTNNFGNVETRSYDVSGGQNYFSLLAVEPQLIRSILISSNILLSEMEQIRVGDVVTSSEESTETQTVPEPAEIMLFGVSLLALSRRLRRRAPAAAPPSL